MLRNYASFRDPAGYVFEQQGELYRAIDATYFSIYDHLHACGLYARLVQDKILIPHVLISRNEQQMVIKPQRIPFISYPSEWSFSMLKEAALLHLKLNTLALQHDLLLKDASGYNVQFLGSRAVFIDTLSFDRYLENKPWYAFGQFCRHFIAPLLLMKYSAPDMHRLLASCIDGIQLDLTARLLPFRTHLYPFIQSTIHRHAATIAKHKHKLKNAKLSKKFLRYIFAYLLTYLENIKLPAWKTQWHDYYENTNYSSVAFAAKQQVVTRWLKEIKAVRVLDIGGNNGFFSRGNADYVITADKDPLAIEQAWQQNHQQQRDSILPLLIDITNPTPAYGFANLERASFLQRIKAANIDCSLLLAVLHHLCITYNCRFQMLAELFASTTRYLIIEFADRQDSRAAKLLANMRESYRAFDFYNQENFITEFSAFFQILHTHKVADSHRTLYLMQAKPR